MKRLTAIATALVVGLLSFFHAVPANASGEVTYPGIGWAYSSTVWKDRVYCLGNRGSYWMEATTNATRKADKNGRVYVDVTSVILGRLYHGSNGAHYWYRPGDTFYNGFTGHYQLKRATDFALIDEEIHYFGQWGNPLTSQALDFPTVYEDQKPYIVISAKTEAWPGYNNWDNPEVYTCQIPIGTW